MKNYLELQAPLFTLTFTTTVNELPFKGGFKKRFQTACSVFEQFLVNKSGEIGKLYPNKVPFSLSVTLCGDQKMRTLNREFRNKDKTTDVLSFPLFDDLRSGEEFVFGQAELGDIFISKPVMEKQAQEFEVSDEQEFYHLLTHGFLHLCGFDHEISRDEEIVMEALEKKLIDRIYKKVFKG